MDEYTALIRDEVMRAIADLKNGQNDLSKLVEQRFREISIDFARNYVRLDVYDEQRRHFGERMGAAEQHVVRVEQEFTTYRSERDKQAKNDRRLAWTSLGAPVVLLILGLALSLVVDVR